MYVRKQIDEKEWSLVPAVMYMMQSRVPPAAIDELNVVGLCTIYHQSRLCRVHFAV